MQPRPARLLPQLSRFYTTAPPPPPPPKDRNSKGRAILSRMSRAFTFSLSSVMVAGAIGLLGLVLYLIFSELFLPSGDTKTFNKALRLIESSEVAKKSLGFPEGERLKAYGDVPGGKWIRNRPPQAVRQVGLDGKERLIMKFRVETKVGAHAIVTLEQVDTLWWLSEFAYIALDVPYQKRVYVVEPKFAPKAISGKPRLGGFLGLKWGPKEDAGPEEPGQ